MPHWWQDVIQSLTVSAENENNRFRELLQTQIREHSFSSGSLRFMENQQTQDSNQKWSNWSRMTDN